MKLFFKQVVMSIEWKYGMHLKLQVKKYINL
jgi:hypothetical protein